MPRTVCMILRKTPFQDTGFILTGISPDYGRVDLLCRGIRKQGGKKFPLAGLFREISIDFREPKTESGLVSPGNPEPVRSHDDLAQDPDVYLAACGFAGFLLKNARPMVPLPRSYLAVSRMFTRCAETGKTVPWLAYAKLAFLHENGFVSVPPDKEWILEAVLSFTCGGTDATPRFTESYRKKFIVWIESLADRCSAG